MIQDDCCEVESSTAVGSGGTPTVDITLSETAEKAKSGSFIHARALLNAALPHMRLPPEIWGATFKLVQAYDLALLSGNSGRIRTDFDGEERTAHPYRWMRILHVCQYWRQVALSSPFLWTTIVYGDFAQVRKKYLLPASARNLRVDGPKLLCDILRRSAECPLSVYLALSTNSTSDVTVLRQLGRMRDLSLFGDLLPGHIEMLNKPVPMLQTLVLRASILPADLTSTDDDDNDRVPSALPALFGPGYSLPSLRALSISRVSLFPPMHLPVLTQLRLGDTAYDTVAELHSLLIFLDSIPALEDLMFDNMRVLSIPGPAPDGISEPRAHLSHLNRLVFSHCYNIERLMQALDIPSGGTVSLVFTNCSTNWSVAVLPEELPHIECLRLLGKFAIAFHEWHCVVVATGQDGDAECALCMDQCKVDDLEEVEEFAALLARLMYQTDELLLAGSIADELAVDSDAIVYVLNSADQVHKLTLMADDFVTTEAFLNTLIQSDVNDEKLPLPLLRELHLPDLDEYETLRDVIEERRLQGLPIESITFHIIPTTPADATSDSSAETLSKSQQRLAKCQERALEIIGPLIPGGLNFTHQDCHLELPDISTTQSSGPWNWPLWSFYVDSEFWVM